MKKKLNVIALLAEFFDNYLPEVKGMSDNTAQSYKAAVRLLFEFMEMEKGVTAENVCFSNLTGPVIEEYLQWLEDVRLCSRKTRNQRLAALSSFAKFAIHRNVTMAGGFASYVLNISQKRVPQRNSDDVVYFLPDELSIILNLPNRETISGRRDVVLMSVLYASGARAQEICDLTVNDITLGPETRIRLVGKGNKARRITIPSACAELLKVHMRQTGLLDASGKEKTRYVFSSQRNEHMTISCVEEIVAKYVRLAKMQYPDKFRNRTYTPHSFRHTIAVNMLESGCSLPAIKAFLGHASIQSTMIYATVTSEQANKVLREHGLPVQIPQPIEKEMVKNDTLWFLR